MFFSEEFRGEFRGFLGWISMFFLAVNFLVIFYVEFSLFYDVIFQCYFSEDFSVIFMMNFTFYDVIFIDFLAIFCRYIYDEFSIFIF